MSSSAKVSTSPTMTRRTSFATLIPLRESETNIFVQEYNICTCFSQSCLNRNFERRRVGGRNNSHCFCHNPFEAHPALVLPTSMYRKSFFYFLVVLDSSYEQRLGDQAADQNGRWLRSHRRACREDDMPHSYVNEFYRCKDDTQYRENVGPFGIKTTKCCIRKH